MPFSVKQAAVASVVFVDVQTMLLDNLVSSSQCCCDGRIANVWQRLDENYLRISPKGSSLFQQGRSWR
jgi:hypothetical protein